MNSYWFFAASAGATLLLAIAAFWAIWQNHQLQIRERRERLLNEIIEWAMDVAVPQFSIGTESLLSNVTENDKLVFHQLSQASHTHKLRVRGNYYRKIAPIFTKDLGIAIEKVITELEKHANLIATASSYDIGKHQFELEQAANKVIEEATKIKTKDIC